MNRLHLPLALVALASFTCGAPGAMAQASDPSSEVIVTLNAERFDPADVELRRGVRLTFHNLSASEVLTVVASDGSFESWPLGERGQWTHIFSKTGRYEFHVKEHPKVKGSVEVR